MPPVVPAMVWLGGAAFVASLAYTFYFYAVVLASAAGDPTLPAPAAVAVDAALFGVFALHHSLFARTGLKHLVSRLVSERLERSVYVWISSGLLVLVCLLWRPVAGLLYSIKLPAGWLLYAVQLVGLVFIARAAGILDPLELAGIRQAVKDTKTSGFRRDGPFGVVRHPIYLGWMLLVFGAPHLTANRLVFAIITSLYLVLAIPWEERSLIASVGEQYRAYQTAVRWRLIPGIW
jgi:methanethiol S-methyltransferase